ncbi:major tail protein [Streptomyces phage Scap1]|uniref:Major tail protein n=1 Tax=Streptomyces phage Scap1 TaxID=2041354 RepID=A0A2D1GP07_9CAUD|nr:major tail protein [Streptomyces phage Scap1]ATN93663.1 major tail protein [Streptomyces phage Scap1]
MTRLEWDAPENREFETGVDRGVLYLSGQAGVPWVGLTSVEVAPEGGGTKSYYLDGEKYLLVSAREEFGATINAFTYPPQFAECDGSRSVRNGLSLRQQRRKQFGFSWRTRVGNGLNPDAGYKIHLVYNALAEPSGRSHESHTDSVDLTPFSWSVKTKPPAVPGYKRTSHVEIDSRTTDPNVLGLVEEALYGTDEITPYLPSFAELIEMYDAFFVFVVTDNGDGTATISGPDEAITQLDDILLQFNWPTVVPVDEDSYTISDG